MEWKAEMAKKILAAFIAIFLFLECCGRIQKDNEITQRMEKYLTEMENAGFFGSVLVALNGEKIVSRGYGFRNIEQRLKNTPTTIFDIGSITKQFTSAAVLKLEMQGRLSTDDELSKYFSFLPEDKKSITIHDLLRHQSGLKSTVGGDYEKITKEEFLKKAMDSPLRFKPGTSFSYSNIGYSLLAMIIEQVSGETYETYLHENLWKPARMESTGYSRPKFDANDIAVGYYHDNKAWGKPTDKAWDGTAPYWHLLGNGGILSSTEDIYKWHQALAADFILSAEAKKKLYHPKLRAGESEDSIYAYGWDVSITSRNTTRVWHNGSNHIFYADFLRFIDEDVVLITLSNKSHPDFDLVNDEISKMIFRKKYTPIIPVVDNEVNRAFTNQIIQAIHDYGIDKAKILYKGRSERVSLLEFEMRGRGFSLLDNNQPELAIQIFEMNVFAFPHSAKALQELGEAYMETGKKDLAIRYFKESLAIEPDNRFVKAMIKELEK
jgi:CubicO group peptidase (beta-lactamase class C family)